MSLTEVIKKAGISEDRWQESIDKHDVAREEYEGISYYRIMRKVGPLGKCSIVTCAGIIFDFPRIARILHLENGLKNAYAQPFYVEEKVDGYNVRIVCIRGKVLAFSRGGYVCPFSTDRIADFLDIQKIFADHPDLIVCGEFAGPDNPYNIECPPYVKEDIRFFAFDLMLKNTSRNLPVEERLRIFDKYGMPTVRRFGRFSSADILALKEMVKELDDAGSEGIVFKPTCKEEKTLKYVTFGSCLRDIRCNAPLMAEIASEYFTHRIIRAAMYRYEQSHELNPKDFTALGEALLKPIYESVKKAADGELIREEFLLRFREEENIQRMMDHLQKRKVHFEILSKEKAGFYWQVRFARKCYASYDTLQSHLGGMAHVD